VMAHAQKPEFVFQRNGRVHLNPRGASVQSTTGSRGVRISGSDARYTVFRGSVKGTGFPFHSPVSPSLPLWCVTVCHRIPTGVYQNVLSNHLIILSIIKMYNNNYRNFCNLFDGNWVHNIKFIAISRHSPKYSLVRKEGNFKKIGENLDIINIESIDEPNTTK